MAKNELTKASDNRVSFKDYATALKNIKMTVAGGLNDNIIKVVDKTTAKFVDQFNLYDGLDTANAWRKARLLYLIARNWKNLKKPMADLVTYYNGNKSQFYNYVVAGEYVDETKDDNGKLKVVVPTDVNGVAFTVSNYALIVKKYKDKIDDGTLLATMTQKQIADWIKNEKGVVKTEKDDGKTPEVVDTDTETSADTETDNHKDEAEWLAMVEKQTVALEINGNSVDIDEELKETIIGMILEKYPDLLNIDN